MAGITLVQAEAQLTAALAALTEIRLKVTDAQSYSYKDRTTVYAQRDQAIADVKYWQEMVVELAALGAATSGSPLGYATFAEPT